ncbi:rluD [Symbiodinium sp. KB8]|nr:rluD [Symbiodinium sp. KB8]
MQACGIKPDGRSFSAAINPCRGGGLWELAFEHVRDMAQAKAQYDPVVFSSALGTAGQQRWEVAVDSLTSLQQLLGGVDVVAFGAAVGAVASTGTWPLALHTATSMATAQVSPNSRVLTPLLSACDAGLVWSKAIQYLPLVPMQVCIRPAIETRNAAATACSRAGCWSQALAMLEGLGLRPDRVAHRIAVSACLPKEKDGHCGRLGTLSLQVVAEPRLAVRNRTAWCAHSLRLDSEVAMSGTSKEEERPRLERFDGTKPSEYRRWRRKAELMLLALPTTFTKDRWGAKVLEYLAGEAEEVCENSPLEKIVKEDGHKLVFEGLDGKHKELQKDALHKHLTEYFFGTGIRANESYRNLTVRLETAYRRLQEHSVELPEEVRGWFLSRKLQLDPSSEAMILTHTRGSLSYKDVNGAVQAIFPQGVSKSGSGKSKEVFEAIADGGDSAGELDDGEGEDVFQAVADQIQAQDEYDDEDAIEVFETYADIRRKMQQKKMGRGYRSNPAPAKWALTGTVRGKIEQLKAKSRCHICQQTGHWKRECPRRKHGGASGSGKTNQASDAMVTEHGGEKWEELDQEFFLQEEDIDKLEIYLAEQDGRVDVVLADPQQQGEEGEEVRGDLEHRIFEFFKKEQGMIDFASAEGEVPQKSAVKTSEVNAAESCGSQEQGSREHSLAVKEEHVMSYLGNDIEMEAPLHGYVRTPLIDRLIREVQPQLEAATVAELSPQVLDQTADAEEDEPEGLVPGLNGGIIFDVGKFQKMGAISFAQAYRQDKPYVAWVRKFVKGGSQDIGKTSHPTMSQFRLYIALRDQRNSHRIRSGTYPVTPIVQNKNVVAPKAKSKAKAMVARPKAMPSASTEGLETDYETVTGQEWIVTRAEGEVWAPNEIRRQRLLQRIEAMTHELEALQEEDQDVQELVDQVNNAVNSMSCVQLQNGESMFERRMELRRAAKKAFCDADAEMKIRSVVCRLNKKRWCVCFCDMVYVRNEVSARGAGNFYDLSVLENPPDDQPARANLDSIAQESQRAEQAAHRILEEGAEDENVGEPMQVETPMLPTVTREDPRGSEPEGVSPSKRQRVGAEVSQLNLALRANPELLDRGVASSSMEEGSQGARACDVPVPEDVDDLEVTVGSGRDHWIVDHQRSLLVRVHEDEQVEEWRPMLEELPVLSSELESVCQSVQYDRRGRKHCKEYEWKEKHRGQEQDCMEVSTAKRGSSPATDDIKARWCIRGYLDPDLLELDTSAPTLSAEGFAIAMQLIASHGWSITIADVEGAFLRGDDLSPSRGRLFVDLPPGGIEGYDETCLVEAVKTVYGLADDKLREMFPFKHWKVGKAEFLGKWLEQQNDGSIKDIKKYGISLRWMATQQMIVDVLTKKGLPKEKDGHCGRLGYNCQRLDTGSAPGVALALLRATPCVDEDFQHFSVLGCPANDKEPARVFIVHEAKAQVPASAVLMLEFFIDTCWKSASTQEITESALQAMNTFQASELASLVWSLASITCAEPRLLAKSFEYLLHNHRVRGLPFRELASLAMSSAGSCFENCASSLQAVRLFQAVQDELISQAASSQLPAAPAVLQDLAARVLDTVWACQFSDQLGKRTVRAARTLLQDIGSRFSPSVSLVSTQQARQGDPIGPGFPHAVLELGDRCVIYKPPSLWQVDDGKDEPQDASLRLSHFTQALYPPRCWPILKDRSHSRGFLHRLDIPTSGLILTAKTHRAFYDLRLQLSLGQMMREYCVLSHGFAPCARSTIRCRVHWFGNGRQAASIVAAAGRPASSKLKVLGVGHFTELVLSLLAIHILTGRQHQIRLQMSHVGHPTVSDKRYFSLPNCLQDLAWCPRNFLHRYRLTFLDRDRRPAEVREPLPCDLRGALGEVRPLRSEAAFRSWMAAEPPKAWSELASVQKALCQVLLLHGGELPVSIAGDELRRRHSQIWKDWKSKVPDASLLRLCSAAQPYGLSLENLESLDEQAASSGEPVIRLQRSEAEAGSFVPLGGYDAADSQQEFPEESNFLRSALVSRFERHPSGSQGGAVPVAWLTIALEKELLRHIRFFPQYEQAAVAIVPELGAILVETSAATATSQTAKAVRKQCMANRLVAFLLLGADFIYEPAETEEPAARLMQGLVRRTSEAFAKESFAPRAEDCQASPLTSRPPPATSVGEGRRTWRRAMAEMPRSTNELTETLKLFGAEEIWVLFLRAQGSRSKEAALMALEFEVAALHAGIQPSCWREVAPGLVVLATREGSLEQSFLSAAGSLTALRRPPVRLSKHAAFETSPELAAAVAEFLALQGCSTWWLEVLLREPPVDASLLPLKPCHGADMALDVVALAGPDLARKLQRQSSGPGHVHLVAFQAGSTSYLVGQEVAIANGPCLPASWHQMWSSRNFKFSAGLDSWVASTVISIVLLECEKGKGSRASRSLLDACCGSGTLAAVAAASGRFAAVMASDINSAFAERAQENFRLCSFGTEIQVLIHDATTSFADLVEQPDVVVANPPWGWRIGSGSDTSLQIIRNLMREFPEAVIALICPELVSDQDVQHAGFALRWSCTLGQSAVWILCPVHAK